MDGAIEMYQELHKWEEAIRVAEARAHPQQDVLRKNYFQWLINTKQEGRAAWIKVTTYFILLIYYRKKKENTLKLFNYILKLVYLQKQQY